MCNYNLEPSPHHHGCFNKIEHWFTRKGWETVGANIIKEFNENYHAHYRFEGYDVVRYKVRARKTKPAKIHWKDDLQVMCIFKLT
jgi:hypothetical protein